jgi:hypothetical protein
MSVTTVFVGEAPKNHLVGVSKVWSGGVYRDAVSATHRKMGSRILSFSGGKLCGAKARPDLCSAMRRRVILQICRITSKRKWRAAPCRDYRNDRAKLASTHKLAGHWPRCQACQCLRSRRKSKRQERGGNQTIKSCGASVAADGVAAARLV